MINYLPHYLRKSEIFKGIIASEEKQFEKLDVDLEDLRKQLLIDTATWAIPIYEKEIKIIPIPNSSLDERRAVIKAKWQSQSKLDKALLEAVASAILQTIVHVSFDGRIVFTFESSVDKTVSNFSTFYQMIDDIKPAHLPIELIGEIREILIVTSDEYSFEVPYMVCNDFTTDALPGALGIGHFNNRVLAYHFDAFQPICGTFLTSKINSVASNLNVELDNEYRDVNVLYRRVSENLVVGEGEI